MKWIGVLHGIIEIFTCFSEVEFVDFAGAKCAADGVRYAPSHSLPSDSADPFNFVLVPVHDSFFIVLDYPPETNIISLCMDLPLIPSKPPVRITITRFEHQLNAPSANFCRTIASPLSAVVEYYREFRSKAAKPNVIPMNMVCRARLYRAGYSKEAENGSRQSSS